WSSDVCSSDLLPPGSHIGNPLDVSNGDASAAYPVLAADPQVAMLIEPWTLAWPDDSGSSAWWRAAVDRVTGAGRGTGRPVIVGSLFPQPLNDWAKTYAARHGIVISPDLDRTLAALGALYAAVEQGAPDPAQALTGALSSATGATGAPSSTRMITEAEGREILSRLGLPVVAGRRCAQVDEVVRASRELTGPLVLKLDAPEVGHRDRVGGVRLGLTGETALREAAAAIQQSATAAGVAPD